MLDEQAGGGQWGCGDVRADLANGRLLLVPTKLIDILLRLLRDAGVRCATYAVPWASPSKASPGREKKRCTSEISRQPASWNSTSAIHVPGPSRPWLASSTSGLPRRRRWNAGTAMVEEGDAVARLFLHTMHDAAAAATAAPAGGGGEPMEQEVGSYALLYTLYGHTRSVVAVAFAPDGERLATAGADRYVQVWSTRTGRLLHTLQAHTGGINGVCWTRDGKYLASVSDDRTVRLWSVERAALVHTFEGHTSYVMCVACHPQSTLLVSGGFDETIRLWDVQRGTCHRTISAHSEAVSDVDFSSDGTMIASCSYDGLMYVRVRS